MNSKFNFGSIILLIIVINIFTGFFDEGDLFGLPSWIGYFVLFGIFTNILSKANKNKNKTNREQEEISESTQWSDFEQKKYTKHECEYCGHTNDSLTEYCENCGAKQLPQ
jgi:hypothetical protein